MNHSCENPIQVKSLRLQDKIQQLTQDQTYFLSGKTDQQDDESKSKKIPVRLTSAKIEWIHEIVALVNEAYLVDAYFKKPNMSDRTDAYEIESLIKRQEENDSNFCLCCLVTTTEDSGHSKKDNPSEKIVGVFMVEKKLKGEESCCCFGLMAVHSRFKGIGYGVLVLNNIVVHIAREIACRTIDLLSISEARKLRDWYRDTCGFQIIERVEAPQELLDIILPGFDIYFLLMRKSVSQCL